MNLTLLDQQVFLVGILRIDGQNLGAVFLIWCHYLLPKLAFYPLMTLESTQYSQLKTELLLTIPILTLTLTPNK